ncbi:hypothetical protein [Gemmata sp.]|uniref:hypothetical protein n=1 Tax=Gemmata sp. TaxID=1914242 RepID=UPI003F6F65FC
MPRSPHASHLNPRWGTDPHWTERAGGPAAAVALSGGQVVIEASAATASAAASLGQEQGRGDTKPDALRPLPCVHLGRVVKRVGCKTCRRDDTRVCDAGRGNVCQAVECEACSQYEPDDATAAATG